MAIKQFHNLGGYTHDYAALGPVQRAEADAGHDEPHLDVVRKGDDIEVRASVPGVAPGDIQITVENDVLTINGQTESEKETAEGDFLMRERRSGSFHRALRLPDTVDVDKAETSYDNGVVTINFPKLESKKAKKLSLTVG